MPKNPNPPLPEMKKTLLISSMLAVATIMSGCDNRPTQPVTYVQPAQPQVVVQQAPSDSGVGTAIVAGAAGYMLGKAMNEPDRRYDDRNNYNQYNGSGYRQPDVPSQRTWSSSSTASTVVTPAPQAASAPTTAPKFVAKSADTLKREQQASLQPTPAPKPQVVAQASAAPKFVAKSASTQASVPTKSSFTSSAPTKSSGFVAKSASSSSKR